MFRRVALVFTFPRTPCFLERVLLSTIGFHGTKTQKKGVLAPRPNMLSGWFPWHLLVWHPHMESRHLMDWHCRTLFGWIPLSSFVDGPARRPRKFLVAINRARVIIAAARIFLNTMFLIFRLNILTSRSRWPHWKGVIWHHYLGFCYFFEFFCECVFVHTACSVCSLLTYCRILDDSRHVT